MSKSDGTGVLDRLRGKLSARRAKTSERAHTRGALKAEREAPAASKRKHSSPPTIGGGVG